MVCSLGEGSGAHQCGMQCCAKSLGGNSRSMAMWSTWEVMAESLFAQVQSLPGVVLENVINERVCDACSFRREPVWGGPAPTFAYIDGVALLPALTAILVIFLLDLTLLGPFLGLEQAWLSPVFAYCSVSDKQKK